MARVRASGTSDHEHTLSGEKLSLLAVFAHPEDEAFGPAGTLARYAGEGIRVSLVTALREAAPAVTLLTLGEKAEVAPREKLCACITSGTQRMCLIDRPAGYVTLADEAGMEERLVRLMRELRPQVVVTYGPDGLSGDPDHILISRLATSAFNAAGDALRFPQHLQEGLTPYQPKKLYYNILPLTVLEHWGVPGFVGVPDEAVTTVLDVSSYAEAKLRTLYCHRHRMLDYARWLTQDRQVQWEQEYFTLAASRLRRTPRRETDLFDGLR